MDDDCDEFLTPAETVRAEAAAEAAAPATDAAAPAADATAPADDATAPATAPAAAVLGPPGAPRDLFVFYDGTCSKSGVHNSSNVLHLYQLLRRHPRLSTTPDGRPTCFYQAGLGTSASLSGTNRRLQFALTKIDALAGYTFDNQIAAGYAFLCDTYAPGDRIWMFGFSRGGFAAQSLASLVKNVGVIANAPSEPHERERVAKSTWVAYRTTPRTEPLAAEPGLCFHDVQPYFVGLWDAISQLGTKKHGFYPAALHVRHALSLDERRSRFQACLYMKNYGLADGSVDRVYMNDVQEVYFPGNHSDVGGGGSGASQGPAETPAAASRPRVAPRKLSDVSLAWMLCECIGLGLALDTLHGLPFSTPATCPALTGAPHHDTLALDARHGRGRNVALKWWLLEFLPLPYLIVAHTRKTGEMWSRKYVPNFGRARRIPEGARIHWSVFWKQAYDADYRPSNFPKNFEVCQ
ncbi:uncharacterized protein V1510DRAFT_365684 [Dipodascopsis tothii]|uniref:uncharacterized protein n=1 Tax=Dipodascopsis tothii TaxID=44089 RepID=UPI0034CD2EB1